MSLRDYEIVVRRDSTIPEGRTRALKRMTMMLAQFPQGVPDRANCFHELTEGWVLSDVIGHADADELKGLLGIAKQIHSSNGATFALDRNRFDRKSAIAIVR